MGKGAPALQYLSRYLYQGVLPDSSICRHVDNQVSFTYQDSQTRCQQVRSLPAVEFLWLILQHVLPKGLRRVREYGLLRGNAKKLRQLIQLMQTVAGATFPALPEVKRALAMRIALVATSQCILWAFICVIDRQGLISPPKARSIRITG